MAEQQSGAVGPAGEVSARAVPAGQLDPEALERAIAAVERLEARVWATARYGDGPTRVALSIAVPYTDGPDARVSIHQVELADHDASALEAAFETVITARLPQLLREGRKHAAAALLAAESRGEV